jgi:hypothetical protein
MPGGTTYPVAREFEVWAAVRPFGNIANPPTTSATAGAAHNAHRPAATAGCCAERCTPPTRQANPVRTVKAGTSMTTTKASTSSTGTATYPTSTRSRRHMVRSVVSIVGGLAVAAAMVALCAWSLRLGYPA